MTPEEEKPDEPVQPADDQPAEEATDDAPPAEAEDDAGARLWRDGPTEAPVDETGDGLDDLVIEPEEAPPGEGGASPVQAADKAGAEAKAEIQPPREPAPLPVESLDACPNCGSPMREKDALVCMRCGYDLKQLKVIETETEDRRKAAPRKKEAVEADEGEERRPLARAGLGGLRLPLVLAAIGAAALIIGYLAGFRGLFPPIGAAEAAQENLPPIEWSARFTELGRFPLLTGIWTLCGLGALVAASWMFGRPLGDARLAAARMLGIVVLVFCVQFIPVQDKVLSFAAEAALSLLVFFLLSMLLYRLKPRDAGTLMALAIVSFVVLYLAAHLLTWAV